MRSFSVIAARTVCAVDAGGGVDDRVGDAVRLAEWLGALVALCVGVRLALPSPEVELEQALSPSVTATAARAKERIESS
jgi:hypothetical protein